MVETVAHPGGLTRRPMAVLRAEEPVDAGAEEAWWPEAKVGHEAGDGVGEVLDDVQQSR